MRFYIADCHFYHEALNTKMDKRGFASAEQMNEYMIQRWNEKVRNCDETVILGDFSFGDAMQTNSLLKQLNGKKYLIEGNHDRYLKYRRFDKNLFEWIEPYKEIHDNGRKVILSHYPIMCYRDELLIDRFIRITKQTSFLDFEGKEKTIPCCMINCFCVFSDYAPLTLDEWIENDQMRRKYLSEEFPA